MSPAVAARRGDIWMVDFSSPIGAEAAFERPVVIVGNNAANESAAAMNRGVVTVVPVTGNTRRVYPFQGQGWRPAIAVCGETRKPRRNRSERSPLNASAIAWVASPKGA